MKSLKERVKQWVAKDKGGVATISNIKKHYAWFRATNPEHWMMMAMAMMPELFPDLVFPQSPKNMTPVLTVYEKMQQLCTTLRLNYGVLTGSYDHCGRCTVSLSYEGFGCGYIGWLDIRQCWVYSKSRGISIYCSYLDEAVEAFLSMNPDIF